MRKLVLIVLLLPTSLFAQEGLRNLIDTFRADVGILRRATVPLTEARDERLKVFYRSTLEQLQGLDFARLPHDAQVDYVLLRNHVETALRQIDIERAKLKEEAEFLPFMNTILNMELARKRLDPIDAPKRARELNDLSYAINSTREAVEGGRRPSKTLANRIVGTLQTLRGVLRSWYTFYDGYDPIVTWWCAEPYRACDTAIEGYINYLRTRVIAADNRTIIGDPIGRTALLSELQSEMIPYTPEELVQIANREFAWCEAEMIKASREMGFGDDWKAALEKVKNDHVEPGKQPEIIRFLALEAIEYLEKHDLVTIPPLAKETWRMEMMTPQQQLVSPFFLGGETIQVSFPTSTMSHEAKEMSMRGNNIHFARATVHHELIPGHHLQGFMAQRFRNYRSLFSTPFFGEGWALYWEMLLWDHGFQKSPENRVGMLFWRMHRCARIIFSLGFHLGTMTPQECIDFLVDRVGHERANAEAEVRRSFAGNYGPLYQAAYLLGGLQLREIHRQLVLSGKMTNKEFHDTILRLGSIPVDMIRVSLTNAPLTRDYRSNWRFYPGI